MTPTNTTQPFKLLQQLAEQGRKIQIEREAQSDKSEQWRGIGFQLAGQRFITPMSEVEEVLYLPSFTRFPGVKPWLVGVANVRGRLLSVTDLGLFFGLKSSLSSKRSRVLTTKHQDLYAGLIVEEVLGIQSISLNARKEAATVTDPFTPYVSGAFEHEGRNWTIFSLSRLLQAPEFFQVAV